MRILSFLKFFKNEETSSRRIVKINFFHQKKFLKLKKKFLTH